MLHKATGSTMSEICFSDPTAHGAAFGRALFKGMEAYTF